MWRRGSHLAKAMAPSEWHPWCSCFQFAVVSICNEGQASTENYTWIDLLGSKHSSQSRSTCEWALLWLKRFRRLSSIYGWAFMTVETLQQRFSAVIDQVYFGAFGSVFSLLHLRPRAAVICSERGRKKNRLILTKVEAINITEHVGM